jgi:hypothetical protein
LKYPSATATSQDNQRKQKKLTQPILSYPFLTSIHTACLSPDSISFINTHSLWSKMGLWLQQCANNLKGGIWYGKKSKEQEIIIRWALEAHFWWMRRSEKMVKSLSSLSHLISFTSNNNMSHPPTHPHLPTHDTPSLSSYQWERTPHTKFH